MTFEGGGVGAAGAGVRGIDGRGCHGVRPLSPGVTHTLTHSHGAVDF